ncbi:prephenate dehydrogenase/arogenate dehydrogenase family protein [candidate division KSB1 bacterium]|nr:prephenate dehydrogenase/arogenate dehydrogenase family protein [candidate division KSB1 bacterium]
MQNYNHIAIVGIGLIGGSLALALKKKGYTGTIVGVDSEEIIQQARERNAVDKAYIKPDIENAVKDADLIFLCTPIAEIIKILQTIGKFVKPSALITDVGSTKRKIMEIANIHLPSDVNFIGGHPMAGSEFSSIDAADPFLFENTTWVLTPGRPLNEEDKRAFGELLEFIGAKVLLLLPNLHDEIAAAVSHLPQMAAVALMHLAASRQLESPHFLKMAAGGFRDMTRISSSPFGIWTDILQTNNDMIENYIDAYITELQTIKKALQDNTIGKYFDRAAQSRLSIPKDTKGFLKPHYDLLVSVEDRPGMIADISKFLAAENINIKDIEVLKIRENEGGTIRLAFSSESDRDQANHHLSQNGFECRKRE